MKSNGKEKGNVMSIYQLKEIKHGISKVASRLSYIGDTYLSQNTDAYNDLDRQWYELQQLSAWLGELIEKEREDSRK